ncbi:MAG TPA: hypothetical protein VGM03_18315, partial [Phycisphaerae bacterium]
MQHRQNLRRFVLARALALGAALATSGSLRAGTIYYVDLFNPDFDAGSIKQTNTDGSFVNPIVDVGGGLRSLDVDTLHGKVYWTDVNNFVIRRANLDGSNIQDLITSGLEFPSAIRVDGAGGKFYWGDQSAGGVYRADLDGSNPGLLIPTSFNRGITLDLVNGQIYWSTSPTATTGSIMRASLDGTGVQPVITGLGKPANIALDLAGGKIYWTDLVTDSIHRADLNGANVEQLFVSLFGLDPRGIAFDPAGPKVYWGQDADSESPVGNVQSMNPDGSFTQIVVAFQGLVNDLVLVPDAPVPVTIASANPPTYNPFVSGQQPYVDVLDTGSGPALTHGIGGAGTPSEDFVTYSPISVTFSGTPNPAPDPGNVSLACTGGACPSITGVSGSGAGPYQITLSSPIPPTQCTTLTFTGLAPDQKLQYRALPGDTNMDGTVNTQDLLALVQAVNNGLANISGNRPRYNINRSNEAGGIVVNTQDFLREVQLLNGINTTQVF